MPDAWEILFGNSTLSSGDAWEHLNNQAGGSTIVCVESSEPQILASEELTLLLEAPDVNLLLEGYTNLELIMDSDENSVSLTLESKNNDMLNY